MIDLAVLELFKKKTPSIQIKPLPVSIVLAAQTFTIVNKPSQEQEVVANMICIAFYYCMHPGEYTGTTTYDQAFALEDIVFYISLRHLDNFFAQI